ncbi:MAG: hypothetical protein GEU26_10665 [Nitrososphaeraceae archaeon]|nr:hypothetical protein [Nitrososphaeraceae archaeon]
MRSDVVVDGTPVAKLDVKMSLVSGELDYQVNSLANVTELYTKDFDLHQTLISQAKHLVNGVREVMDGRYS